MQPDLLAFQRQFVAAIDHSATGPLAVYRNTVIHGAVEALQANFPVVAQLLGSEMFEGIAVEFVTAEPPRSPILAAYGESFADWIDRQAWASDLPYLGDVARVERLHVECLLAADAQPFRPDPLAGPEVAGLRLALHPAARFAWLANPAMTIWLAHQAGIHENLDIDWAHEGAIFTRPACFELRPAILGRASYRLLGGIRLGESVGRAMRAAARLYPEEDTETLFQSLVNLGAFAAPVTERT